MVAEHVELALLEDTFLPVAGLQPPFSDRMARIAGRTGGSLMFDVRIFGDPAVERMAAIAYGAIGTAIAVLTKRGDIRCVAADDRSAAEHMDALAAWSRMPAAEQAAADYTETTRLLLAALRRAGRLERASA